MKFLVLIFLLVPSVVFADVYVSEVAWMGDSASANNEWIELFNDGSSSVSLDGWKLSSVDGSPDISLSGSIGAGSYFILERTSDESLSGVSADLIYSGALANTGEVLVLSNNGTEVDGVDGSGGWSIGGNNSTKETLQRSGGGWKTASPTPRAGESTAAEEEEEVAEKKSGSSSIEAERVYGPAISIEADTSVTGYVGSKTKLSATAFDKYGKEFEKAVYVWSFGDGGTGVGKEVAHTYVYPGTYQAVVHARYGMWEIEEEIEVSVKEVPIGVVGVSGDAVVLKNESSTRVDVSGWYLVQQGSRFEIPGRTFVLPGVEIAFPHSVTGFRAYESVGVVYPNGVSAASYVLVASVAPSPASVVEDTVPAETQVAAPVVAEPNGLSMWVYVFVGLLLVGVGSIVYLRRYG